MEQRQSKEEQDYEETSGSKQTQDRPSSLTPLEESTSNRNRERSLEALSTIDGKFPRRKGRGSSGNEGSSSGGSIGGVRRGLLRRPGQVPPRSQRKLLVVRALRAKHGAATPAPEVVLRVREHVQARTTRTAGPGPVVRVPRDSMESDIETATNGASYTCGYCRHTFKSQYCYRKHAKRHLLSGRANNSAGSRQKQEAAKNRREVRLLDLNVQYYPCKICGCKFPSYYFVHKHKKLCHASAEERPPNDEASGNNAEDQESTSSTTNDRQ